MAEITEYQFEEYIKGHFRDRKPFMRYSGEWCIPYLGRWTTKQIQDVFSVNVPAWRVQLPWEGVESFTQLNAYDSETHEHYLQVECVRLPQDQRVNTGRIRLIQACHMYRWETTSNWQDHSESHERNVREPTADEIAEYCALLDKTTVSDTPDRVLKLFRTASMCIDASVFVENESTVCQLPGRPSRLSVQSISKVIDWGRVTLDALISKEFRLSKGITSKEEENAGVQEVVDLLSFTDFYEEIGGLETQMGVYLSDKKNRNKRFESYSQEEKLKWMSGEYIHISYVLKQRRFGSKIDLRFDAGPGGHGRFVSGPMVSEDCFCVFDRKGFCVGYVNDRREPLDYTGQLLVGQMQSSNGDGYYLDQIGNMFLEGKYLGFVLKAGKRFSCQLKALVPSEIETLRKQAFIFSSFDFESYCSFWK